MVDAFVTVPPDSTGKNVGTTLRSHIDFDNQVNPIVVGDIIIGLSSSATGVITAIVTEGFAVNSGRLYLRPIDGASIVAAFTDNEAFQISALTVADVNFTTFSQNNIYHQNTIIVDPNNPEFKQKVDEFGATVNTFAEGSPQFDGFGKMRTVEATRIAEYAHDVSDQAAEWTLETATGGAFSHTFNEASINLSVTNSNGSSAIRTTNRYHKYYPSYGSFIDMTVLCGDSGKTGNTRRWGFFDANDGMFFELVGTTLRFVVRSSTSGSPVDTVVEQTNWQSDKLDGTGISGVTLDLTKVNIYWIDFTWLGSGGVRFGIYGTEGQRIVSHRINQGNVNVLPFTRTGTLPIRFENFNTAATSGSSDLRHVCAAYTVEGLVSPFFENYSGGHINETIIDSTSVQTAVINAAGTGYAVNDVLTLVGGTGTAATFNVDTVGGSGEVTAISILNNGKYSVNPATTGIATTVVPPGGTGCTLDLTYSAAGVKFKPVSAVRASATINGGNVNRNHIILQNYVFHITNGPAHIHLVEDTTLFDATYSSSAGSLDQDKAATGFLGGKTVFGGIYATGTHKIDLTIIYDILSRLLRLDADGVSRQNIVLVVQGVAGSTPTISSMLNWQEL